MGCASAAISGAASIAAKDVLLRDPHNSLRRSQSAKDLCDRASMRRSQSDSQLRCSLNTVRAISTEPKLKNSRSSGGLFPFQITGSILPNRVRSLLFETDYVKEPVVVDDAEEEEGDGDETEKRANWVERLMELRTQWRSRQRGKCGNDDDEDDGEGKEDEDYCSAVYDSDSDEEEEETILDRESFSRLLVRVPLSETKLFSKLSFLCNIAYVIPELKAEDLRNYYDLHLVTSSLEKKAEAAAIKAKLNRDSTHVADGTTSGGDLEVEEKRLIRPSVAYEIAASAASYVHSRAKGLLSLGGSDSSHETLDETQMAAASPAGEQGGASPTRVYKSKVAAFRAATTITAVVAAEEDAKMEAARDLQSLHSSPCEWFVCDDPSTYTRCFVIQGSDSLASWQANLFFDPTKFEDTDVHVHRGIYEAAKGIYEQFMPEILNHLKRYGERAKLQFIGHSLGGSLSLLVHLMLVARGVVKPSALRPVVTFGSPFVFCGGKRVLDHLRLDESHVYAVMMHRDIVPRAFSCNYPNHVAQVLKRISGAFRSHPCLNNNMGGFVQKLLYSPMGQLFILQPDEKSSPPHPLLPPGSGLYALDSSKGAGSEGSMASALRVFLNSPHPLETLSDPTAYGSEGSILRDHDSSNYLKAVNGVLRQHTKLVVRKSRKQRLHHWWPLLTMSPPVWSHQRNVDSSSLVAKEVATGV
ncbi:hypothetical protein ACLOJK_010175 [Asimina triloba]